MKDEEEKLISEVYEAGELKLEEPSADLLRELAGAAENTFKKGKRINIRLSNHDLEGIQRKAAKKAFLIRPWYPA